MADCASSHSSAAVTSESRTRVRRADHADQHEEVLVDGDHADGAVSPDTWRSAWLRDSTDSKAGEAMSCSCHSPSSRKAASA